MPKPPLLPLQVYFLNIGVNIVDFTGADRQQNLTALPGLAYNLRRSDHLYPFGTGFKNMASLSGLRCSWYMAFDGNYQLTTLDGLQNVRPPPGGPGTNYYIFSSDSWGGFWASSGQPFMIASLAAIRGFAGCPSGSSSPWTGSIWFSSDICTLRVTSLAGS